jgi:hypothetical protein
MTVKVKRSALGGNPTARRPIRLTPSVDGNAQKAFVGIIVSSSGVEVVTLECIGVLQDLSRRLKDTYSPLFELRPIATKTTATSIEDPDDPDYQAGILNYAFWKAGLRPFEQAADFPSVHEYYSCDQALFAPDFSWLAGEDGYAEVLRACRASGGQVYQRDDGVVVYRQPFLRVSTPTFTFADPIGAATNSLGVYGEIDEQEDTGQLMTKVVGTFTPRIIRPVQTVIEDSTPRQVDAGEIPPTINLEPQLPLYQVELSSPTTLPAECFQVQRYDGAPVSPGVGGYLHLAEVAAQRISITYENDTAWPHVIYKLTVRGAPIAAGEKGTISVGSGSAVLTQEDNIFIQNEAHATRLAEMALLYYGQVRKVRVLSECPYHPDRYVGETVALTDSVLAITNVPHMIIDKSYDDGAAKATYTMVDVSGIPVKEDYFIVGTTDYTGQTKKLTF